MSQQKHMLWVHIRSASQFHKGALFWATGMSVYMKSKDLDKYHFWNRQVWENCWPRLDTTENSICLPLNQQFSDASTGSKMDLFKF